MRTVHIGILLLGLLAAAGSVGCTEGPQIVKVTGEQAAKTDQARDARRQRTLRQSESERIY